VIGEVGACADFLRAYRTYLKANPTKLAEFCLFFFGIQGNADCKIVTGRQQVVDKKSALREWESYGYSFCIVVNV
jgi:hypothetical protein